MRFSYDSYISIAVQHINKLKNKRNEMKMRSRQSIVFFAVLSVLVLAASIAPAATIVGSKHDFSASNTGGPTPFAGAYYVDQGGFPLYIDEVCVFCHTPHSASTDAQTSQWLWNRVSTPRAGDTYAMYTSTTVSTGLVTGPTGVSLMCMSCHDGVTSLAVNTLKNAPGAGNPAVAVDTFMMPSPGAIGNAYAGAPPLYWGANLGEAVPNAGAQTINMTNDHPISFEWNYSKSDLYAAPTNPSLRLFGASGKRLECATCHLVHDPTIPPFLAMDNSQSAMCLACHNK